jgi:small GTP-binding protein
MTDYTPFKCVVFGDGGVGKTTLINRYTTGVFNESTAMTIGVDFHVKKLEIDGHSVSLQLWDFMGEERFRVLLPGFVSGAEGGIFMFDITRFTSLQHIKDWTSILLECIDEKGNPIPLILVGGKLDLKAFRSIDMFYGVKLAEQKEQFINYIECSSKTGENVDLIFETITREMLKREGMI